jgi:hypothetical protein
MKDLPPSSLGLSARETGNVAASAEYDRTHCPVCNWEIDPASGKCMLCGTQILEALENRTPARMVANTVLAVLKLWYVPAIYWATTIPVFTSWQQVLPLYSKDPHQGLAHWYGAIWGVVSPHPATAVLTLPIFALLWIMVCWPEDANPAGRIVSGLCTWGLFFPVPLLVLLAVKPGLAHPISEMVDATLRYLVF